MGGEGVKVSGDHSDNDGSAANSDNDSTHLMHTYMNYENCCYGSKNISSG